MNNNIISDIANENVSFNHNYTFTFSTTLLKSVYLDAGYSLSLSNYEGRGINSKFQNHQPNIGLTIEFLKGLL